MNRVPNRRLGWVISVMTWTRLRLLRVRVMKEGRILDWDWSSAELVKALMEFRISRRRFGGRERIG